MILSLANLMNEPDGTIVEGLKAIIKTPCKKPRLWKGQWRQNAWIKDEAGDEINAGFNLPANEPLVRNLGIYIIAGQMASYTKLGVTYRQIEVANFSKDTATEPPAGQSGNRGQKSDMSKADWAEKDKQMARMCALNNATNKICTMATILNTAGDEEKILELATKFFNWVRNGEPTQTDSTEQMASVTQTAKDTDNVEDDIPF